MNQAANQIMPDASLYEGNIQRIAARIEHLEGEADPQKALIAELHEYMDANQRGLDALKGSGEMKINRTLLRAVVAAEELNASGLGGERDRNKAGKACQELAEAMKHVSDQDADQVVRKLNSGDISYYNGWVGMLDGPKARRLRRAS